MRGIPPLFPAPLLHKVGAKGGYAVFIGLQAVSITKADFVALFLSLAPAFSPQVFHNVTVKPAVHNDVVMNTNGDFAVSLRGVGGNDHVL